MNDEHSESELLCDWLIFISLFLCTTFHFLLSFSHSFIHRKFSLYVSSFTHMYFLLIFYCLFSQCVCNLYDERCCNVSFYVFFIHFFKVYSTHSIALPFLYGHHISKNYVSVHLFLIGSLAYDYGNILWPTISLVFMYSCTLWFEINAVAIFIFIIVIALLLYYVIVPYTQWWWNILLCSLCMHSQLIIIVTVKAQMLTDTNNGYWTQLWHTSHHFYDWTD